MLPTTLIALVVLQHADTLRMRDAPATVLFDGAASVAEYGAPSVMIPTAQGKVEVWLVRRGDSAFVAARITDSTYYWGDDFVVSIDPLGDGTPGPGHDDTQWYLRRMLDSSVANQGRHGRWMPPSDDPDWRLGKARSIDGWEVQGTSDAAGWSVELLLPVAWFIDETARQATIAFRSYDNDPSEWYSWPAPHEGERASRIEMLPARWAVVVVKPGG